MRVLLVSLIFVISIMASSVLLAADSVVICAYSKDRPLQLYAFLESLYQHISGTFSVRVIYRATNQEFKKAYEVCFDAFKEKDLLFLDQDGLYGGNIKALTLHVLNTSKSSYVAFAVDDIIVKDSINLDECIYYLKTTGAYGFYLRLGKNINYSYAARQQCPIPNHTYIETITTNGIISWKFSDGNGEWCYPNSLDMSIYENNAKLKTTISLLNFNSPNTLEGWWAHNAASTGVLNSCGLCYLTSKIVNVPLTLVQQDWPKSYTMGYSIDHLLDLFKQGYRIDINYYQNLTHSAPHHEVKPFLRSRSTVEAFK